MADNPTDKYLPRESSDVIDELFRRQAVAELRLDQIDRGYRQMGGVPLQRIDPLQYPEGHEGQRAIDASDEQHTWYSNGAWRKAGAAPHVWAMLSTEPLGFESDGDDSTPPFNWVDWYAIYISDQGLAGGYFDFVVDPAGGQFGDDRGYLLAKQSGLYTFTQQLYTSDLTDAPPEFAWQTKLNVMGDDSGGQGGGQQFAFPGQITSTPLIQERDQPYINESGGDDLIASRSWTFPVRHPNPGNTEARMGEMRLGHTPIGSGDPFWTIRLWVVRHGDIDWTGDFDTSEYTWESGA